MFDRDARARFQQAMTARALLVPVGGVLADGRLHRCDALGPHGRGDGSYIFYGDGLSAGGFQNWRDGAGWETWRASAGGRLTPGEERTHRKRVEAMRKQREGEKARRHAAAAALAATVWCAAGDAAGHAYLTRKRISPYGARQIGTDRLQELGAYIELRGPLLVVPLRSADGGLRGLQFIDNDGSKRFLLGTHKSGCYYAFGGQPRGNLAIVEGFATGASVHAATGWPVAVAFDASNLRPVAEALKTKLPDARLVLAGDNDANGVGQAGSRDAAQAVGGVVALPGTEGEDWNDMIVARGVEAVRVELEAALATPAAAPVAGDIEIIRADAITVEAVCWLWHGWLARGKLHLIAGAPGTGKTTIALAFAAILSRGVAWPDGTRAEPGDTLIWSGEDDPSDSIVPRFLANGGDATRLHIVGGRTDSGRSVPFNPARDMGKLAEAAARLPNLRLIILDPVMSAVEGDAHKAADTRRGLQPVVDMAAELGAAVLGVTHFGKNTSGRDTSERVIGSQAFVALARLVMATAKPAEEGQPRRLVRSKSNIGPDDGGFEYELMQEILPNCPGVFGQRVVFGQQLDGTARELLSEIEGESPSDNNAPARDAAVDWLRRTLADGPMPVAEVKRLAKGAGVKPKTLRNAYDFIGVVTGKGGFRDGWTWALPSKMPSNPEDAPLRMEGTFGAGGHLRVGDSDAEVF